MQIRLFKELQLSQDYWLYHCNNIDLQSYGVTEGELQQALLLLPLCISAGLHFLTTGMKVKKQQNQSIIRVHKVLLMTAVKPSIMRLKTSLRLTLTEVRIQLGISHLIFE